MKAAHGLAVVAMVVLAAIGVSTVEAAPPWLELLTADRVAADPNDNYKVGKDNGPWMIMATSFSGEGAQQQARTLAYELRKRYKLPAYTHRITFDFNDAAGRGIDEFGAPVRMRYQRGSEIEEIAVLVGNYPAVDAPDAQRVLQKLKHTWPECLDVEDGEATHQTLAGWRWNQKQLQRLIGSENKQKGPMGHAFITTNPLLPKDYYSPNGLDELVLEMNKDVEHSLLDCPGKYSVQVATFRGRVVIDQSEIQAIEGGKQFESELAKAAMQAHKLTEALRLKGWEAYEFHDRYASIVTVGAFDNVGSPRRDGKIEINPQIHRIMQTFGAEQTTLPGQTAASTKVKSVVGIPLDVQPIPVEVPKRAISRELARGLF